jgi:hypothetical protein
MKNLITFLFAAIFIAFAAIANAQSVGINADGSAPNGSAMLDVSSTTKGFLVLNTIPPTSATHVASTNQIIWNWNAAAGALGYKWNTTNNYATAIDMGTSLTKTETGLSLGNYTRYVWAYNACGEALVSLNASNFFIGAEYGGGKVAYLLQSGDPGYDANTVHGIVAAATDMTAANWSCGYGSIQGADGTAYGTGNQNTIDIVAGCISCPTTSVAARKCADLSLNGYSDWYLPSKDELTILYNNRTAIGGFDNNELYWSSSEWTASSAYTLDFKDGKYYGYTKYPNGCKSRAIRSF